LFGYVGEGGTVRDLSVSANFVINFGSNVNYTGIIAGYSRGYISNCSTFGGIIAVLQNINQNYAISYVGAVCGVNAGRSGYGIVDSKNNATIYIAISDEENVISAQITNLSIYAGLIAGANLNSAQVTRCVNDAENFDINSGAKDCTLIVINSISEGCNAYVGEIYGYKVNSTNYENLSTKLNNDKIYTYSNNIIYNKD